MTRRQILVLFCITYIYTAHCLQGTSVETELGVVRGYETETTFIWKSIPYAAPPVGNLRWAAPKEHPGWTQTLNATQFGYVCPQLDLTRLRYLKEDSWNEDCLTLNIWTPKKMPEESSDQLPVMVWIHGGAFFAGAASDLKGAYDGEKLSNEGRVVVVSIQYRLGALGFLAHPYLAKESSTNSSGNYGILDCIQALRWISKNIAKFGGNPASVTVFGESAGAMLIALLSLTEESRGLFKRAILQSPAEPLVGSRQDGELQGMKYADTLGCTGKTEKEVVDCMRSADYITATENWHYTPPRLLMFHTKSLGPAWIPVIDGHLFKEPPRDHMLQGKMNQDVEYLIGFNTHEGSFFTLTSFLVYRDISKDFYVSIIRSSFPQEISNQVLAMYPAQNYSTAKEALIEVTTDAYFLQYIKTFASTAAETGKKVYFYEFSHSPVITLTGIVGLNATHAEEINSIFRNRPFGCVDDDNLSVAMQKYWTAFARSGNPNKWLRGEEPTLQWPLFVPAEKAGLNFHVPITLVKDVRADYVKFWRNVWPKGVDAHLDSSWFDDEPLISYILNVGALRAIIFYRRRTWLVLGGTLLLTLFTMYKCCRRRIRKTPDNKKKTQ